MAGRIFISYRRADTANQAGWLAERLAGHYGRPQVVKDVDSIQLGNDFAEVIAAAVTSCDALLALIGHQWLAAAAGPNDFVRVEIESALTRGIRVIPVLVDGARMPTAAELPPGLADAGPAAAAQPRRGQPRGRRQPADPGARPDHRRQERAVAGHPGLPGPEPAHGHRHGPVLGRPGHLCLAQRAPAGPIRASPVRASPFRATADRARRFRAGTDQADAAAPEYLGDRPGPGRCRRRGDRGVHRHPQRPPRVVGVLVVRGVASAARGSRNNASPKPSNSPSASAAAKVLLTDDFSTNKVGWVDDAHASAGAYTGSGAYRLSVTGYNGQNELARPSSAGSGLSGVTPLNLDASVDVRTLSGAAQGYGLGLAFRGDGNGDLYAFLIEDHAVAIQKWVATGARITGEPAPVSVSDLHVGSSGRLRAVATTIDGGQAVHLELWLNGKKLIDYTDRDHPYTRGYMGLYVESISDSPSTAAAEFDNFTASQT